MRLIAILTAVLAGLVTVPTLADAFTVQLDGDSAPERLEQVRTTIRFPGGRFPATAWVVRDRVDGASVTRRLTPPQEGWLRPFLGDRNVNGFRDIVFTGISGSALFDTRIAEWNGREAHTLWVLPKSPRFWQRVMPGGNFIGTSKPRFPLSDDGSTHDVVVDAYDAPCRACRPEAAYLVRWKWKSVSEQGRWVFEESRPT